MVGLIAGILFASVNPRATRSFLTMSMKGPRPITTWPLLTLIEELPWPESTLTICPCATVLTCTQAVAKAWLDTTECTVLCMKPVTELAICGPHVLRRHLIRVRPLPLSQHAP